MTNNIYIGLIEWSGNDGDRNPEIVAATSETRVERIIATFITMDHKRAPHYYKGDAEEFMTEPRAWQHTEPVYGPITAANWLTGLRAATSAPYWSITKVSVAT